MAPNQSKPQERSTTRNGIKLIKPPIGLERPKQESGKYSEKIKCRTNPTDANSTTYEIPMEYFKEGTPEEWLIFQDKLGRCITGQNATSGVAKFALTRRLLDGQAKTAFENAARVQNAATHAPCQACLMAVTEDVFPPKSLLNQKRYMRRFLRKPVEMTAKDYIARVCEINSYLTAFPTEPGRQATKLPTDELLDLLEFGVPLRWQRAMHLHGFEPQEGNIKSFTTFCERLESSLDEPALKNKALQTTRRTRKLPITTVLTAKRNAVAEPVKLTEKVMTTNHFFVSFMVKTPHTIPISVVPYRKTLKSTKMIARKMARRIHAPTKTNYTPSWSLPSKQ